MSSSTFHARNAAAYEAFMGRWSQRLCEPFIAFAGLSAEERIIDVGCGTGSLSSALARNADLAGIVGIDLSEVYLEHAWASNRDARASFVRGDATRIELPDASFDRAFAMLVLQFIPEPERAVAEMKRVVGPGGVVAAAVWDSYGGLPAFRMFWDAAAHLGLASDRDLATFYFRPMSRPGEMAAAWSRQGLTDVVQSSIDVRMDYANFEDYWAPVAAGEAALGKFATSLAPGDLDRLATAVRRVYCGGEPDGPRSFPATTWVCKGVVR